MSQISIAGSRGVSANFSKYDDPLCSYSWGFSHLFIIFFIDVQSSPMIIQTYKGFLKNDSTSEKKCEIQTLNQNNQTSPRRGKFISIQY